MDRYDKERVFVFIRPFTALPYDYISVTIQISGGFASRSYDALVVI